MILSIVFSDIILSHSSQDDIARKALIDTIKRDLGLKYLENFIIGDMKVQSHDRCCVAEQYWNENGEVPYMRNHMELIYVYCHPNYINNTLRSIISEWIRSYIIRKVNVIFIASEIIQF